MLRKTAVVKNLLFRARTRHLQGPWEDALKIPEPAAPATTAATSERILFSDILNKCPRKTTSEHLRIKGSI